MKNLQFAIRETPGISTALALLTTFAVGSVFFVSFLPKEFGKVNGSLWILSVILVGLTLFVWSVFRLIKPLRYDRSWQTAEMVLVPLYSLMLTLAATVCVAWLIQHSVWELEDISTNILQSAGVY